MGRKVLPSNHERNAASLDPCGLQHLRPQPTTTARGLILRSSTHQTGPTSATSTVTNTIRIRSPIPTGNTVRATRRIASTIPMNSTATPIRRSTPILMASGNADPALICPALRCTSRASTGSALGAGCCASTDRVRHELEAWRYRACPMISVYPMAKGRLRVIFHRSGDVHDTDGLNPMS